MLLILVLCLSTEFGYVNFYGSFSKPNDIAIALTATGEQVDGKIFQYLNFKMLSIIIAFAICQFLLKSKPRNSGYRLITLVFFLFFIHATFSYLIYKHLSIKLHGLIAVNINENQFLPLPIGINTVTNSIFGYFIMGDKGFKTIRDKLGYHADSFPQNNIVIIVEETLRGDHLSINGYKRPTSNFLQELQSRNLLKNFGICAAGATASLASNNLLLTGILPQNPKKSTESFSNPSIFQYAKASNYKTYFFDGQMNDRWAGTLDDYNYVDNFISRNTLLLGKAFKYEVDFNIAKSVNHILETSKGNLIYVIKRGFHFPYSKNYPENKKVWTPVYDDNSDDKPTPTGLINSYDNSLFYNLDTFFRILIGDSKKSLYQTVIIYTGDHGESFLEDGKSTEHSKSAKLEAKTALAIIGEQINVDTNYKPSHHNILPTVLDLMNYPKSKIRYPYSPSLLRAKEKDNIKRYYILPDLNNPKVYAFD